MIGLLLSALVAAGPAPAEAPSVCLIQVTDPSGRASTAALTSTLEAALKVTFTVLPMKRIEREANALRLARSEWLTGSALAKLVARAPCTTPLVARLVSRAGQWSLELNTLEPGTSAEGETVRVQLNKPKLSLERAKQLVALLETELLRARAVEPPPTEPHPDPSAPTVTPLGVKDEWSAATDDFAPATPTAAAPTTLESIRLDSTLEVGGRVGFQHFAFFENRDASLLGGRDQVEAAIRVKAIHPRATAFASVLARADFVDPTRNRFDPEEAWVDLTFPSLSVKVGRLIVSSGTASLYNPTDVLNHVDLRDPLMAEKVGALMVRATANVGRFSFEATYLPVPESHWLPQVSGVASDGTLVSPSRWVRGSVDATSSAPLEYHIAAFRPPTPRPSNSQVAARVEVSVAGADIGVGYAYLVDHLPSPLVESVTPAGDPTHTQVFIDWSYRRLHAITFDFERSFGKLRLTAEVAAFLTPDLGATNPRVADPYLLADVGGDLQSPEFLNGQRVHFFLEFAYARALTGVLTLDGLDSFRYPFPLTVLARIAWDISSDLNFEVDAVSSLQRLDLLISPRLGYQFFERVKARIGVDVLAGSKTRGFFGPFANNSRFIATVEARF